MLLIAVQKIIAVAEPGAAGEAYMVVALPHAAIVGVIGNLLLFGLDGAG